eukprot:4109812-Pyramimonas_sp.AAC.1
MWAAVAAAKAVQTLALVIANCQASLPHCPSMWHMPEFQRKTEHAPTRDFVLPDTDFSDIMLRVASFELPSECLDE